MYDITKIVNDNKLEDIISQYTKLKRDGNEYLGLCPFHNEKTPSFTVAPAKGFYHCMGCEAHGSVIDFIKAIHGVGLQEACKILNGEEVPNGKIQKKPAIKEVVDYYADFTPTDCREDAFQVGMSSKIYNPKREKWQSITPDVVYKYRDKSGKLIGWVIRKNMAKRKMTPTMQTVLNKNGDEMLAYMKFGEPYPIYGIETIKDKGTIYIVEGEKTTDSLRNILPEGSQVITWPQGANIAGKVDWSVLPKNRKYILIPDADKKNDKRTGELIPYEEQAGYRAMIKVNELLPKPLKVFLVDVKDMAEIKDGWDIADSNFSCEKFKEWLKPRTKVIQAKEEEKSIEVQVKERNNKLDYDDTYFKCLGFDGMKYYFYHKPTGQVHNFTAREMGKSNMIMLAPLDWWESRWPKGKRGSGADWDLILDVHLRIQEKVGIFDIECMRGRGAWIDKGRAVLHLGGKVVVDGTEMELDEIDSEFIYSKKSSLSLDYGSYLPVEESTKLVDMIKLARWKEVSHGELLSGWIFASLVCGVMPSRTNTYLTGESGSGKSWIMSDVVIPLMGKIAVDCASTTTESGIRKYLKGDVRPLIFNEAEAEEQGDMQRMKAVFTLARMATDEKSSKILKGSGDGESFTMRSSFIFASIDKSTDKVADENRMLFIELAGSPKNVSQAEKDKDNDNFNKLEKECSELLTKEFIGSLLTRAVNLIPVMRKNYEVFANLGARITGCKRTGNTLAMPLCGLHGLVSDEVVTEEMAIKYLKRYKKETDQANVIEAQEVQCLDKILFAEITCEDKADFRRTLQISEIIDMLNSPYKTKGWDKDKLKKSMALKGILLKDGFVWIAAKQEAFPAQLFKGTPLAGKWLGAIKRLDGVKPIPKTVHFCSSVKSTGIKIPIKSIIQSERLDL